jgi:hypothetical protein
LNARERAIADGVAQCLKICHEQGISSAHLRRPLQDVIVGSIDETHVMYAKWKSKAERTSAAGLKAQLHYLREAWGHRRLVAFLRRTGGVLDAIVRGTSSTPAEIKKDIGFKANEGDVVI